MSTVQTIIGALVADGIALAVSFGASLNTVQQAAILTFVGTTTTAVVAVVGWLETHKTRAKAVVATTAHSPSASAAAAQIVNA